MPKLKSKKKAGPAAAVNARAMEDQAASDKEAGTTPTYINIAEHEAEIASQNRKLWIIVGSFSIVLAAFWLTLLRLDIKKQAEGIGFSQIGDQIKQSLARFDSEIKDRSTAKPVTADDLAAIKSDLERQIKENPDSSLWPTHQLPELGISIQYPDNWNKSQTDKSTIISGSGNASSSASDFGRLSISAKTNPKKLSLAAWLTNNSGETSGYAAQRQLLAAASSSPQTLIYSAQDQSADRIDKIIFYDSTSTRSVLIIKAQAAGDTSYYWPLLEEMARTIKIIK